MECVMETAKLFDLHGKVAMVSGGGDGLGRAMALGLADAGADLIIFSRRLEVCQEVAGEIRRRGVRALPFQCDLGRLEDIEDVVSKSLAEFGRIDILVNNSGRTWGGAPEDIKLEDWQKVIDINVNGTFRCTQAVGKAMIRRGSGKIINISSYAGARGADPLYLDALPYNTSKGALNTFTKDLAVKWARHNITVNAIAPGWFPTRMSKWSLDNGGESLLSRIPMKRYGKMEELMGVVVFLASPASDYMTGQIIGVDGGLSAW
jgi:NAD(P)-dependent dehydrogenase (short-subunit alcohol dehydrogenase family)